MNINHPIIRKLFCKHKTHDPNIKKWTTYFGRPFGIIFLFKLAYFSTVIFFTADKSPALIL